MNNRALGFAALLAVIGVSIVFGMILGGKLNAPQIVLAAPGEEPLRLAAASTSGPAMTGFADIVEQVLPAVVGVRSTQLQEQGEEQRSPHPFMEDPFFRRFFGEQDPQRRPQFQLPQAGSGFIISEDGYVLTNNHVVEGTDRVDVTLQDGERYEAEVVGTDPSIDLALLKIDPDGVRLPTLALGDSESLRVGEWVIAIGNPHEFDQTVTVGVISGKGRRVPIGSTDEDIVSFIQTDAAINFGNSGGPLLDARGNVVGINTAIRRADYAEGIGFALPINHARNVIDQLQQRGFVSRGYIGINITAVDQDSVDYYGLEDSRGAYVTRVIEDGPAERAGLRPEDIIRAVDGEPVEDSQDLVSKIASRQPGEKVNLQVYRKGKTVDLQATLVDRERGLEEQGLRRPVERNDVHEAPDEESSGLGITVKRLGSRDRERLGLGRSQEGVVVTEVEYGSMAFDKGIRPDMIITAVNDEPVGDVSDWDRSVEALRSGSTAKLDVLAGDQTTFIFVRVPE